MQNEHIDVASGKIMQDAREVHTKFSKTFTTWFFPVGDEVRQIVVDWIIFLKTEKLYGPGDPLFPATFVTLDQDQKFQAGGLSRAQWSNATPIRAIFKDAFMRAGLPYPNPHSFRKTLAQLGERMCRTPEEFKAWSQNLGHEQVLTTFSSYGQVAGDRQAELISRVGRRRETGAPTPRSSSRPYSSCRMANTALGDRLSSPEPSCPVLAEFLRHTCSFPHS